MEDDNESTRSVSRQHTVSIVYFEYAGYRHSTRLRLSCFRFSNSSRSATIYLLTAALSNSTLLTERGIMGQSKFLWELYACQTV